MKDKKTKTKAKNNFIQGEKKKNKPTILQNALFEDHKLTLTDLISNRKQDLKWLIKGK